MKIQSSATQFYTPQQTNPKRFSTEGTFESALTKAEAIQTNNSASETKTVDFTSMTRMEMREWVNFQLSTGKMTLDESTPFVGMTIGAENDNTRINFIQKIKDGIEAAIWRKETKSQAMYEMALSIVERYQYQNTNINTFA